VGKSSHSHYSPIPFDGLESGPLLTDELVVLRHKVLNDYQAIIACIFDEGVRSPRPEVQAALTRVADCVHELASSLRRAEANPRDPTFDFSPDTR
jgi:hypothetical protein